jgi:hypothetical protein
MSNLKIKNKKLKRELKRLKEPTKDIIKYRVNKIYRSDTPADSISEDIAGLFTDQLKQQITVDIDTDYMDGFVLAQASIDVIKKED